MASAMPIATVRFSAKIDTLANSETARSDAMAPRIANPPTATGSAAANNPPKTQTSTRKLSGSANDSMTNRSSWVCSFTCQ